jgi:type I restriction enzyme M protein
MVLNRAKEHPGEILLINAAKLFEKGRPKNFLADEHVAQIADVFLAWKKQDGVSIVVELPEVSRSDYNLSPASYVNSDEAADVLPLEDAIVLLKEAEEERGRADEELHEVLQGLGLSDGVKD